MALCIPAPFLREEAELEAADRDIPHTEGLVLVCLVILITSALDRARPVKPCIINRDGKVGLYGHKGGGRGAEADAFSWADNQ